LKIKIGQEEGQEADKLDEEYVMESLSLCEDIRFEIIRDLE
jgi:hypothetical protein